MWEHGVVGISVYSNLKTRDYFNRVSVEPIFGEYKTSEWSGYRGQFVSVSSNTAFWDGNRAYYDLRDH